MGTGWRNQGGRAGWHKIKPYATGELLCDFAGAVRTGMVSICREPSTAHGRLTRHHPTRVSDAQMSRAFRRDAEGFAV